MLTNETAKPGEAIPFRIEDVEQSIVSRFEDVAQRVPNRTALSAGSQRMTYVMLDRRANRIAHAVMDAVDQKPSVIATLLGHNQDQIASLLGILKAGSAYVALDPASPRMVLEDILGDSRSALLLTDHANMDLAQSLSNVSRLNVQDLDANGPDTSPGGSVEPESMAYLVYTSGTTGAPKGVIKSHAAMLYTTYVTAREYGFRGDDRISLLVSMSFAAARFGFLGALLNGAALSMYDLRRDGVDGLLTWLEVEGITILHTIPSTLRVMLNGLPEGRRFEQVRAVVVGGEPLTRHDLDIYQRYFLPACRIVNTYGASETGVISRASFDHESKIEAEILPVGLPVEGQQVTISCLEAITDDEGDVGEICVRGRTVASGYWCDSAASNERFKPDPDDPTLYSYHTGDLGRIGFDGRIWVLGRVDQQVKIRGQRIHLEAVESAIERHADVRSAAVLLRDEDSRSQLHAYIVTIPGRKINATNLRAWLLDAIPQAMIPSSYNFVDALPRTTVGKIDRAGLMELYRAAPVELDVVVPPGNALERRLLEIWEQVLDVKPLSVEDDYFILGGDSLKAIRLFSIIEKELGVRLPLASLFRAPTIAVQAELFRKRGAQDDWSPLVAVQPLGDRPAIFCVSPLVVDVLAYRNLALQIGLDQPFYALYAQKRPMRGISSKPVQYQALLYVEALQTLQSTGPYILSGYSNGGKIAFEMAVQLAAQGELVQQLILLETYGPNYIQRESRARRLLIRRLLFIRRLQRSVSNFIPWLGMHVKTLISLDWPESVSYVRVKTDRRLKILKTGVQRQYPQLLRFSHRDQALYKTPISRAVYDYQPSIYSGDVTIIRAKNQLLGVTPDPFLGWRDFITGKVSLIEVPGYHDSILFGPKVSTLAAHIRSIVAADPSC